MYLELFVRYLHFISIFGIVASLALEVVLVKPVLNRQELARLSKIDALYGICALTVLGAGLSLWLWLGKSSEFYQQNPLFWLKLSLYSLIGILSIYPTVFFIKNRKGNPQDELQISSWLIWSIRIELILLLVLPFLAILMARGIGYQA
ncbi:DUF2214 family protein [Cytophagales bacterium LB-30]|uniref:DUF2214 family protein n=1 Tax=Shiella aurantiaca TaxID=3058365 RepID=A0ABT8F8P3_9BACT|nr:DUF2214 family protein [Shiella aurantiaca]MDN4166858.1 DUF2214 family protein [Shiella aurantiaca]